MATLYQQIQGMYTAGDVLCAVDCVRALPNFNHVIFVNHDDGFDQRVCDLFTELGASIRRQSLVAKHDLTPDVRAIIYHCVGHDDSRRGEYIRFRDDVPGVALCAWIHTPGLCGGWAERYNFLRERAFVHLLFPSSFNLHHTPGIDITCYRTCSIVHPAIDAAHYATISRLDDGVFRVGRWSRGIDYKYADDFLALLASIDIPNVEFLCMGIPGKFRHAQPPGRVKLIENGAMTVESLLSQLDVFLLKTHAPSWHEGWCRTVTEAMAAGVIPIVENRGGLVDQVIHGYNGFLCDANDDFKHFCELLYYDQRLRASMSANARSFAGEYLHLDVLRDDLLAVIMPQEARRLNLGCGYDIRPGYVNVDTSELPGVDAVIAMDPFHPCLPFADEQFDEIIAFHVLEHVAHRPMIIEELWRIARHNARIKIKLPDRNHSDAFLDPTHFSYWEADTIDFYLPGHLRSYYSPAKFGLLRKDTTTREIYWELLAMRHRPTPQTASQKTALLSPQGASS